MPHDSDANLTTIVDPDGKMRWGGYLSGLKYSSLGPRNFDDTFSFSKYIVEGTVVDDATGLGIEGIAIQIGNDIAMSNASGAFYMELTHQAGLVSRYIVQDDVDLLVPGA